MPVSDYYFVSLNKE